MKHSFNLTAAAANEVEPADLQTDLDSALGGQVLAVLTNWDKPLDYCNIDLPPLTRDAIHDHLVKTICCHPNVNVREAAETFPNFDIWDMTDELLELGETLPELRDAVLGLDVTKAADIISAQPRSWLDEEPCYLGDLLERTQLLSMFLFVQGTAISTPQRRAENGVSPLVRLAMECATLALSVVRNEYAPWTEVPSWLPKKCGQTFEIRQSKIAFEKIFTFYRSVFVQDSKAETLNLPLAYSPDYIEYLSDIPGRDEPREEDDDELRVAREIVKKMRKLAREGLFNASHNYELILAELGE